MNRSEGPTGVAITLAAVASVLAGAADEIRELRFPVLASTSRFVFLLLWRAFLTRKRHAEIR